MKKYLLHIFLAFAPMALAQNTYSGTLPVVHLTTLSGQDIDSKDYYVDAVFWIDSVGARQPAPFKSAQSPDTCQVKGRGNWTWRGFDKKPYRIKLGSGAALLGMNKSKHWALMAAADDNLGFLKNPVGYMLSRKIGLRWTPSEQPVELVLNGQYWGLYFLTETVRVDKKRVNITEQEDGTTEPDSITGGWLVEIDNYKEENRVELTEGNGTPIFITPKTPEVLSNAQRQYLTNEMSWLNQAIYDTTAYDWVQKCDVREAAKYYLVQELMVDCESYHGSCYLHKDIDSKGDVKWYFGPVWDFGNALNRLIYSGGRNQNYIWVDPEFSQTWIGEMYPYAPFQKALQDEWGLFRRDVLPGLANEIRAYANTINEASKADYRRWCNSQNVQTYNGVTNAANNLINYLDSHIVWLYQQWGEGTLPTDISSTTLPESRPVEKKLIDGKLVIVRAGQQYTIDGRRQK